MTPEAFFDVAFLLGELDCREGLHESELHTLAYLGQLAAMLSGEAPESWGYSFARHKLGGPYATELSEALVIFEARGQVMVETVSTGRWFKATPSLRQVSEELLSHSRFRQRAGFLKTVVEVASVKSLPFVTHAILEEPQLRSASTLRRLLGAPGAPLDALLEQFEAVTGVLSEFPKNSWLRASLWLEYLAGQQKEVV